MSNEFIPPHGFVWQFPGIVQRIVDGDTIEAYVFWRADDVGEGVQIRVDGINALERTAKFGSEATAFAQKLLPEHTGITLIHHKREKYGRFLARIVLPNGDDFGALMLAAKASDGVTPLAVPYNPT